LLRVIASEGIADALNKASPHNSETYNVNPDSFAELVDGEGNIWFGEHNGVHRFFYSPLIRPQSATARSDPSGVKPQLTTTVRPASIKELPYFAAGRKP